MASVETDLIRSDPHVMMGKPVVAGTRITAELILEKLAAGESVEDILDAHPRLTREAVSAALLSTFKPRRCYSNLKTGEST